MLVVVTYNNIGLKSGSLSCTCLLLDWTDGERFLFEFIFKEEVDNLIFLDWNTELEDSFKTLDLACLNQSTQLCEWSPFLLSSESSGSSLSSLSWSTAFSSFSLASSSSTESLLFSWWGLSLLLNYWCWLLLLLISHNKIF